MTRYSLHWRLLAGAGVAILAALALAWAFMTLLFEQHLERRVEQELRRDALQLIGGLAVDESGSVLVSRMPTDPRFDTPASGLYWQVSAKNQILRSRSLWDQALVPSPTARAQIFSTRFTDGPFGRRLFLEERIVRLASGPDLLVQLAAEQEEITVARNEFSRDLALFLLVLWGVLALASWIQVWLGLRPLLRLQKELAALRHNAAERLSGIYPREVEPLTLAINELANAREADLKRARQRAADLAHGMKTPLAALAAQSRLIREGRSEPGAAADGLDRAVAAAAAAVETELARARAAASRHARKNAQAGVFAVVRRLLNVLEHTDKGMRLDYVAEIPDALRLGVAEEDLSEILGPLLENAVRFARRQVRVTGAASGGAITVSVEDDGPGIAARDAAALMVRGARLDQAGAGHGLGLAIAREMAEATGGKIALSRSSLGGLRVELLWPDTAATAKADALAARI